jgi:hypothetical protein
MIIDDLPQPNKPQPQPAAAQPDIEINKAHVETAGDMSVGIFPAIVTIDFHGMELDPGNLHWLRGKINDFVGSIYDEKCQTFFDHEPDDPTPVME